MNKDKNIVGIIPARGGSKGIPHKNIKELFGKPLIAYTIEAAKEADLIDRIIVTTDDDRILLIAEEYGAEVIKRPDELATDESPTEPAVLHVLEILKRDEGFEPEVIVLLQPTSPLRDPETIEKCIKKVTEEGFDSILTVCRDTHFHWEKEDGKVTAGYDFRKRPRRQEMKPLLRENGAVYVTKRDIFIKNNNRLGGNIGVVEMEERDSLELDTPFEFFLAEKILEYKESEDERD